MSYSTRTEAIEREIVQPIEASGVVADARAEFNIDAIADKVLGDYSQGYALLVDQGTFWATVEANAKEAKEGQ